MRTSLGEGKDDEIAGSIAGGAPGITMRILLNDYAGYPFILDFAQKLAERGHEVLCVYAGYNTTPQGNAAVQVGKVHLQVKPLYTRQPLRKDKFFKRWLQEREYGYLVIDAVKSFHPDVVLSANTPLDAQWILLGSLNKEGVPFVFWLQDIIGIATQNILARKMPLVGRWIGKYYIFLERFLLRKSSRVIAITPDFLPLLERWGVPAERISVIPNWAPLDTLPVRPKKNPWAIRHNLGDKFCFMYTGTLGMKHDPSMLLQLALRYRQDTSVRVVVISEGPGANWLREQKRREKLDNLVLMGYQPFEELPNVMGAADVLVALLKPDAGVFSVPSKVLSYLCAQRPVLAAIPQGNLAARIIQKEKAGLVVTPKDNRAFVDAAQRLRNSEEQRLYMGAKGRSYAERYFDIAVIVTRFERIFEAL